MPKTRALTALIMLVVLALLATAGPASAKPRKPKPQPDFKLTLLHNNDGESKLDTGDSVAKYGGAPRFKTVVDDLRSEADAAPRRQRHFGTLLVSSGDNFLAGLALLAGFESGPPWPDATVLNALRYDAVTLGNHEFDFGQARLAEFIAGVREDIPFISANLDFTGTLLEPGDYVERGQLAERVIVRRQGARIGIIGLTTPDIRSISSPGNVGIEEDLARVVNEQVRGLRQAKVDKIVVSAHLQGIAADNALIPETRGVDVWIAGGGDDLLASDGDLLIPGDVSVGEYPSSVEDSSGNEVLVVSTSGEYKYVGRLTVVFDRRGRVERVNEGKSGPVRVSGNPDDDDFAAQDPRLRALVDEVDEFSADLESQVIGETEVDLLRTEPGSPTNDPIRRRESGFGNLVADSFLYEGNALAAQAGVDAPQVAIANGGGIRADIPEGEVNRAQTFSTLPFFNQVVVVEDVECEPLRQLIERGVSALPSIDGRFANVAGLRIEVDPSFPAQVVSTDTPPQILTPGQRVRNMWLDSGTPQDTADDVQLIAAGIAVPGCPTTDVATTDFTARGGDSYPFASQDLSFEPVGAIYNQALEDYISADEADGGLAGVVTEEQYPADPTGVRRITIAGD